ncbi:similar to vacuolar protein sorting-associated protein VPS28 [Cyanidioschyzon merolae strain 10D]|jgi:ESCRT-I complex subunit VPS28|uniref:Vacuolar protein sorting-associated protein 28 homolog n=1 Tax=Cyanidioschyzon merolae (strain NIES-3377 / 10D) TaxID=280699 RepID=M1VJ30_CYAM1|nr:similar to vacuolar protein sorting-associated protein VPS28 [Cyanidioschyzon merolae strain 10D]BAM81233.1 similar to vacuolar protein sorting-associated protein VPS28 [Cyanidioschyzon merolae strain 10D]|eukprot:XP_005537269.1 similar to vacuolar protein sorting-associated protein VPS28 [Cyanidioschyzon merolae strain 10D]
MQRFLDSISAATQAKSPAEHETLVAMADLYAIITCVEYLERAWRANAVSDEDYTRNCSRLIAQFRATRQLVMDDVPSVISFLEEYHLAARAAMNRLQVGVPATVEHANSSDETRRRNFTAAAIQATEAFLTFRDALELGERSVDRLLPYLREILLVLGRMGAVFGTADGDATVQRERIVQWVRRLDAMHAYEQITEEDKRQLAHDVDTLYDTFRRRVGELEM